MKNSEHDNPRSKSRLMEALNYAAEASATMIPLVALILGIGMMRFLPANVTTPLFKSDQEARKFFEDNGIGIPSKSPILLRCATSGSQQLGLGLPCHQIYMHAGLHEEGKTD